jgi:glycerol uptake facilitator-like aquaporin
MGSFFLVFMYLSSTDPKTKFTKDAAIQTIILSGSYLGAMLLAGTKLHGIKLSPVNPAVALGIFIFNGLDGRNIISLVIFLSAPIGGSFLALLFFRFIYQKTKD